MNKSFSPYTVAMVTPFEEDGRLGETSVRALTRYLVETGVPALLVSGSTGEQHSMTVEEKAQLYAWTAKAAVPVYAGVAAVRTSDAVRLAQAAERAGCAGIMLGFPPYVRLTALDALEYIRRVGAATPLPLLLYNNPLRTAFDLLPETLLQAVVEVPTVQAVKEAGDASRAAIYRQSLGDGFQVFSGGDRLIAESWAKGYNGLTSIAGNLWPREVAAIVEALASGDRARGEAFLKPLAPLFEAVIEPQLPSTLKYAMRLRGLPGGWCREPLGHLGTELERRVEAALQKPYLPLDY